MQPYDELFTHSYNVLFYEIPVELFINDTYDLKFDYYGHKINILLTLIYNQIFLEVSFILCRENYLELYINLWILNDVDDIHSKNLLPSFSYDIDNYNKDVHISYKCDKTFDEKISSDDRLYIGFFMDM